MILAANKILCEKSFLRIRRPFTTLLSQAGCINEMGGTWQPNIVPSALKSCTNWRRRREWNEEETRSTVDLRVCVRVYMCVNVQNTHITDRHVQGGPKHDHYSTAPTFPGVVSGSAQITSLKEHRSLHGPTIRQCVDRLRYRNGVYFVTHRLECDELTTTRFWYIGENIDQLFIIFSLQLLSFTPNSF